MEMYIPKTITVGFQERSGTFTNKLAYVIYTDDKGVLRKENSWNSWRNKKIEAQTFDNTPSDGFTFNKGIQRGGYSWGSGRSVIRVYDDRDFEFEVTVDNLVGILMHSDVSKRDIVEKCVYAWYGKDLVLLPVNSEDYQKSLEYTKKIESKFSAKELVVGRTYSAKREKGDFVYLGRLPRWEVKHDYVRETGGNYYARDYNSYSQYTYKSIGNKHVFMTPDKRVKLFEPSSQIAGCINEEVYSDFANLYQEYLKTHGCQDSSKIEFRKLEMSDIYITSYHTEIKNLVRYYQNKYQKVYNSSYHGRASDYSLSSYVNIKGNDFNEVSSGWTSYHLNNAVGEDRINKIFDNPLREVVEIFMKDMKDITEVDLEVLFYNGFGKLVRVYMDSKTINLRD